MPDDVKIPSTAVDPDGGDIEAPLRAMLEDLGLLGKPDDLTDAGKIGAVLSGPPQSVALIEAGATAAAKWWSTGLGAAVAVGWGAVRVFWPDQHPSVQRALIIGACIATAALVLAIAYLLASDVRGRADAAVATIQARSNVAIAMIAAARDTYAPAAKEEETPVVTHEIVPVAHPLRAMYRSSPAADPTEWDVVALVRSSDDTEALEYVLVAGSEEVRVTASELVGFVPNGASAAPRTG